MKDGIYKVKHNPYKKYIVKKIPKDAEYRQQTVNNYPCYYSRSEDAYYFITKEEKKMKELKKVTLIGLNIEVEYDEEELYYWMEEGTTLEGRQTTDGRIIVWDDAHNGWLQVWRI